VGFQAKKGMMASWKFFTKFFIIISALGIVFGKLSAQTPYPMVDLCISEETGKAGDTVCVKFTVNNFIDVEGFTFQISFDRNLIEPLFPPKLDDPNLPDAYKNGGFVYVDNFKANGFIRYLMIGNPITLPDGTVIFEQCFKIVGQPGNESRVFLNTSFPDWGVTRKQFSDVPSSPLIIEQMKVKNGKVKIVTDQLSILRNVCETTDNKNNGVLEFYFAGGQAPYSYTLNGGAPVTGITENQRIRLVNLPQGSYKVEVTDALGNKKMLTTNITETLPYRYTMNCTDPTCSNRAKPNGKTEINITDTGPYSSGSFNFAWSNYYFETGNKSSNKDLGNGKYYVTITDPSGCRLIDSCEIFREPLSYTVDTLKKPSCSGAKDGQIRINVSGGTPWVSNQYNFFVNSIQTGRNNVISNLKAGKTTISVVDSLGCSIFFDVILPEGQPVSLIETDRKDTNCHDGVDGLISVSASGTNNFIFEIRNNLGFMVFGGISTNNTYVNNNLTPGAYRIIAKDASNSGCADTLFFNIGQPTPIDLSDSLIVNPSCQTNIGSITLNPRGGEGPYTFQWSHTSSNTASVTGLGPGQFAVTVTDSKGCTGEATFVLKEGGTGNPITVQGSVVKEITCKDGKDGTIKADVLNGTGASTYNWRRLNETQVIGTTATLTNMAAGIYIVEATNNGCTNLATVILVNPAGMDIVLIPTVPTCPGGNNGSLGANVSGGNPPYNYQWRKAGNTAPIGINSVLAPLSAGNYELTLIDSKGCLQDTAIVLKDPPKIDLDVVGTVDVNCFGLKNGRAEAVATGGTQVNPVFSFFWSTSSGETGDIATKLSPGLNWVIANDGICVSDTVFFAINTVTKITLDFVNTVVTPPSCAGKKDGIISIQAKGGQMTGFTYNWISPATIGPVLSGVGKGKYIVRITDAVGCSSSDSILVNEPDSLKIEINPLATRLLSCKNPDNGQIGVLVTGGNPGVIQYQWSNNGSTTSSIGGLGPGNYCVTATDIKGCQNSVCLPLVSPPKIQGKVASPEAPKCFGETTCIKIESVSGGSGNKYTFQINQGIRYPIDSCVTVFAGPYRINILDSAGCFIDTMIVIPQPDPISITLPPSAEILLGEKTGVITPLINAPFGILSSGWFPAGDTTITCVDDINCVSAIFGPSSTRVYTFEVTDNNGCITRADYEVRVKDVRNVYFPNIFAPRPDGSRDGINQYFQVVTGNGVESIILFEIYDRWGNKVFSKSNFVPDGTGTDGWDGTFRGEALASNVYVFYALVSFTDGQKIPYKGTITLVR